MRFVCAILPWTSAAGKLSVRLRQLRGKSVYHVFTVYSCTILYNIFLYIFLCPHHISDLNPRQQLVRSLQSALLATATVVKPCRVRVAHTGLVLLFVCDTTLDTWYCDVISHCETADKCRGNVLLQTRYNNLNQCVVWAAWLHCSARCCCTTTDQQK